MNNRQVPRPKTIMKIKMYILSLWLLFFLAIIATFDFSEIKSSNTNWTKVLCNNLISAICVIFLLLCVLFFLEFRYKLEGTTQLPAKTSSVKNINNEYLAFLTTYIIPFVLVDFSSQRQVIILIILLIVIGAIYVKTNMFYSNPTLALLGYKIYEFDTNADNVTGTFITLDEIEDGQKVQYIRLDKNVFFARRLDD